MKITVQNQSAQTIVIAILLNNSRKTNRDSFLWKFLHKFKCPLRKIPEKRQTMLYSATSTKKTEDLIKVALKKEPIYIGLEDQNQDGAATVIGLEQVSHNFHNFKMNIACWLLYSVKRPITISYGNWPFWPDNTPCCMVCRKNIRPFAICDKRKGAFI